MLPTIQQRTHVDSYQYPAVLVLVPGAAVLYVVLDIACTQSTRAMTLGSPENGGMVAERRPAAVAGAAANHWA